MIVEDCGEFARAIARVVRLGGLRSHIAPSIAAAKAHLAQMAACDLRAAVIDVGLPDGDGVALAGEVTGSMPSASVLLLTGQPDPTLANRATSIGAFFATKPITAEHLSAFLCRAQTRTAPAPLARTLVEYAQEHSLTDREAEVVRLWTDGLAIAEIAETLGVAHATVKTHANNILRKCQESRSHGVVQAIMRRALSAS